AGVCPGTYTVTETVPPTGYGLDPDPTRDITVSTGDASIGTKGTADDCPDSAPANDDAVDGGADFCNRATTYKLQWEKRDQKDGSLLGGASFKVSGATDGPFACTGDTTNT